MTTSLIGGPLFNRVRPSYNNTGPCHQYSVKMQITSSWMIQCVCIWLGLLVVLAVTGNYFFFVSIFDSLCETVKYDISHKNERSNRNCSFPTEIAFIWMVKKREANTPFLSFFLPYVRLTMLFRNINYFSLKRFYTWCRSNLKTSTLSEFL